jgi:tryptophan halogenase
MNIVIAGGGTAGWLAALFFSGVQPNKHTVTVIESSKIGIIGAGEGSTGLMVDLLQNNWFATGTDYTSFMRETDATPKLGIRHKNWLGDNTSYYAPLDGTRTSGKNPDVHFMRSLFVNGPEKMHVGSPMGDAFRTGEQTYNHAYHFDGKLVGQYFKKVTTKQGVKHIDAEINDVTLNQQGFIESLTLSTGQTITGDLFIDCTGFSKILMSKLGVKWTSYKNNLPVNKAIPFILPLPEDKPEPLTLAHALSSGWMWQIPTASRIGAGYVFSDEFISVEDAQKEVEQVLGHEIDPIKVISFDSGRSDVLWEKNCIALGLSAAFAEPLEATSIHTTLVQLLVFSSEFLTETFETTYSEKAVNRYNTRMTKMYDDIKDFLVMHYMGGRTDSEFWKFISDGNTITSFVEEIIELSKYKVPGIFNFDYYYGCIGAPLWNWVLAGNKLLTPQTARNHLERFGHYVEV